MDDSLVGKSVAHFSVQRELGRGGMGVVYEARDEKLGRSVALKVLPNSVAADPARKARFLREARAAAQVSHPAIATVYEIGEADGRLYIAMELVGGMTLRARLDRAALSPDEALDVARQLASALAKAHAAGIVHRDLKPENVMLDEEGNAKILDFGIAKALGEDEQHAPFATREGAILGTPGYMSPEQASGKKCDQRADVFAFGVMLHEMLSGVTPFRGGTPLELVASVLRDEPTPLPDTVPTTPAIRELVSRCLDKSPDARPNDGKTLVELLGGKAPRAVVRAEATAIDPLAKTIATPDAAVMKDAPQVPAVPVKPTPNRRWIAMLAAMVASVGAAFLFVQLRQTGRREARIERTSQSAREPRPPRPPRGSSPRPADTPPLFQCETQPKSDAGFGRECNPDTLAWCDPQGRPVACCGKGLFPVGVEGVCGCPPGGGGPDAPSHCPRASTVDRIDSKVVLAQVEEHKDDFRACTNAAARSEKRARGKVRFAVQVSPDGRVYSARIESSWFAVPSVQTCALDVWRKMRFPPPGGTNGVMIRYPIDFARE